MSFGVRYRGLLEPGADLEFTRLYSFLKRFLLTAHNEDGTLIDPPPATISDIGLPIGTYAPYGGTTDPSVFWLICDGRALSRSSYPDLFTTLGTTFGTGDGSTTFNIPDMRGRFPFGKAASGTGSTLGGTFGTIDHVHTGPSHTHSVDGAPTSTTVVQSGTGATVASDTHGHGATTAAGAGSTGTANPPALVSNFIILVK